MPRTFSLYGVSIEISIVFIYRLYIEIVRKRTCIMNTILFNFNVHIQALNIHSLASLAPLLEFFPADIYLRDIYFSPSRQVRKEIFRFILASFAPLLEFFPADIFFVIYISRQAANLAKGIY